MSLLDYAIAFILFSTGSLIISMVIVIFYVFIKDHM